LQSIAFSVFFVIWLAEYLIAIVRNTTLICLFLLLSTVLRAQQDGFNFVNFASANGLSSNSVSAMLKDKLGYMWFATEDGLNRFDGTNFRVYNHNPLDSNSIGTNQLQCLYEDPHGNLWVGTNRTLALYDRQKDCFRNFNIANGTAIRSICSDDEGHLWIGSYAGLILFDPSTYHCKYYVADSSRPGHLLSNTIICLLKDGKGRLWVGSNSGLYLYQPGTDNFKRFCNKTKDFTSISDNVVRTMAEDGNGNLWIGTINGGLNKLEQDGDRFISFRSSKADIHTLSSNRIYCLVPDRGQLWVGTEEGLNIFDPLTAQVRRVEKNDRDKYSIKGKAVRSIFIDPRGIYWVATNQGGVNKYDKNLAFFHLVPYNPFDRWGLRSPRVNAFAEAPDGDIYVGTDGGGLSLFHRQTGLMEPIDLGGREKSPGLAILALECVGNELWVATFQQGIYVLDIRNKSVKHYTKGDGPRDLPSNDIFCIKKDRKGHLWIGTNGKGVVMYDVKLDIFRKFAAMSVGGTPNRTLSEGFIRAIEEDKAGDLLIGTVGSGVLLFNPDSYTCRTFNRANTNLPLDEAITLHIDGKDVLWAGTPSGGLCRLDLRRNQFANYSVPQGLANAVIYKILEDDSGNLWVSTNKGISCFDKETSRFKNYAAANGLQQSSFDLQAGLKSSSGELFFGGIEGFNYFLPASLSSNKNIPSVVFTDFKIGGQTVVPGDDAAIKENITVARDIQLHYKQNFSVDFTALDYTTPGENRYMYKLNGLDKSWNQLGSSRTAVFTNLDPGRYTLEVKAKNCNGAWITEPASLSIYIKPPFWLTGYAYTFYVLMTGLIIWGIRYRGIRKVKNKFALEQERLRMRQMLEQERLEAERLHEFDQLKIKFLTNLSHEFRTPISLIMGPIQNLQEKEGDPDKHGQLSMVKRNARRLLNLVNQLLDFRKLEEHELRLNASDGDIISFLKEAAESFRDIAERRQIHFAFSSTVSRYYTSFDRDKIERVLFNLLGNAFKFTHKGGWVSLKVEQVTGSAELIIIVADSGIGMSKEEKHHIFDRFFQGNAPTGVMNQGSGIGLSITKEFVALHGGTISVESQAGNGSSFSICLPLKPVAMEQAILTGERRTIDNARNAAVIKPAMVSGLEKLTVLLVEDNDDFRQYLKSNLECSYKIIEASDGKEGWQKAISGHPDVIVSDISMPNMDGIELSRKIKADKRVSHVPIILLTALTEDAYQLKGLETGASDYLTKPFSFEILNLKIRNLVLLNQRLRDTYSRRLNIDMPVQEVQSADEQLLLKVTQFIEANLDSPQLSVEELSKQVFMSHASLYRKVLDLTGETPVEFIRSVRLNKAADLLERSDLKIAEIGYAVGFTTPNYFTRAFKAKFNLSPTEYVHSKRKAIG
jgi:signal transduction histidine kinase/ligand-binding sensor domain-containing protein/AraC-like DNA-binding protein